VIPPIQHIPQRVDAADSLRSYTEATPVLYASNTFSVPYVTCYENPLQHRPAKPLIHLPKLLLPHRIQSIRSLSLFWLFDYDQLFEYRPPVPGIAEPKRLVTADWLRVWEVIASMQGLRHLSVDLVRDSRYIPKEKVWIWLESEDALLALIKTVTVPLRNFRMVMPFEEGARELEVGGRVWKLEKPDEGTEWSDRTFGWFDGHGFGFPP
jgi:hypothetical protein